MLSLTSFASFEIVLKNLMSEATTSPCPFINYSEQFLHESLTEHSMKVQNSLSPSITVDVGLHLQINSLQRFSGFPSRFLKYLMACPKTEHFRLLCKDRDQLKKAGENL